MQKPPSPSTARKTRQQKTIAPDLRMDPRQRMPPRKANSQRKRRTRRRRKRRRQHHRRMSQQQMLTRSRRALRLPMQKPPSPSTARKTRRQRTIAPDLHMDPRQRMPPRKASSQRKKKDKKEKKEKKATPQEDESTPGGDKVSKSSAPAIAEATKSEHSKKRHDDRRQ